MSGRLRPAPAAGRPAGCPERLGSPLYGSPAWTWRSALVTFRQAATGNGSRAQVGHRALSRGGRNQCSAVCSRLFRGRAGRLRDGRNRAGGRTDDHDRSERQESTRGRPPGGGCGVPPPALLQPAQHPPGQIAGGTARARTSPSRNAALRAVIDSSERCSSCDCTRSMKADTLARSTSPRIGEDEVDGAAGIRGRRLDPRLPAGTRVGTLVMQRCNARERKFPTSEQTMGCTGRRRRRRMLWPALRALLSVALVAAGSVITLV
jgi:hypothetical protein